MWVFAGACLFAVAAIGLRLPYLDVPLTADEGGYAEVARLWARGARLYQGDWVDRPQGLLLAFRGLLAAGATGAVGIRLAAAVIGALLGVLVFVLGRSLLSSRSAFLAAGLATCACASPYIEGFTFAGELLAAVAAAAAVVLLVQFQQRRHLAVLFAAGVLAGCALMLKQSAFDAAGAGIVLLIADRDDRRLGSSIAFVTGVALPLVAGAAWSGNVDAWYHAVVGYEVHASLVALPFLSEPRALAASLPMLLLALGPVLGLALFGWRRSSLLVRAWTLFAVVGVCAGGAFHPHYFLQLVAPLSLMGAAGISSIATVRGRGLLIAASLLFVVFAAMPLWLRSASNQVRVLWPADRHLLTDAAVARYVRGHTPPNAAIYVLWSAADLYYLADRTPALPYLWLRNMQTIAGARVAADRLLARRQAKMVIVEQPPALLDPSGRTAAVLRRNYRPLARIDSVLILGPRST